MMIVPPLERHCGSWVVTRLYDGAAVGEFYNRESVARLSPDRYRVETAAQYLGRINGRSALAA